MSNLNYLSLLINYHYQKKILQSNASNINNSIK